MGLPSWLATCSSSTCTTTTTTSASAAVPPSPKLLVSDASSFSDVPTSSTSSNSSNSNTSSPSLQSNLSLQTLPSVPSLQSLSPETLAVSHACLISLRPSLPHSPITCVAVHQGLLYAASLKEINVYDRATSSHLDTFNGQDSSSSSGSVKAVAFSDGNVLTAHQDCKIRVWQMTSNKRYKLLTTLPTVNDRLRRFVLPKNYVSVRRHKKRLWIQHADAVTGLAVNNGLIYSVSWDKTLNIWRASDLRCVESVRAHDDAVNAVAVSADGTVYTGSADKRIRVWAKPEGEKRHALVATLEKHKSAVNALALNDDGLVLFSGSCDRSILVWEREDSANHMAVSGALRGHGRAILCLFNVADLLLSGSADRTVRIWRRGHEGRYCCLAVLNGHAKPVKSLAGVTECGGYSDANGVVTVFSGSLDGEAKVWQVSVSRPNSTPIISSNNYVK
ncbi:Coatomer beta subunit [Parasponia andersonii]|uniref:Coatomer beta subunit n=1 Tax=Parasponia andersonii TaxID=3476 RepID=A0A2P5B0I2_PARAD|nr:Coatomer beta subunit [Parasponia andersonii]